MATWSDSESQQSSDENESTSSEEKAEPLIVETKLQQSKNVYSWPEVAVPIKFWNEPSEDLILIIKATYKPSETIGNLMNTIVETIDEIEDPKRHKVTFIKDSDEDEEAANFIYDLEDYCDGDSIYYYKGGNPQWDELMEQPITKYDRNDISNLGLYVNVAVLYEHNPNRQRISCEYMKSKNTQNPLQCPLYYGALKQYEYSQETLEHLEYCHIEQMKDIPHCRYGHQCSAFKRAENRETRTDDLCHLMLYQHPPRGRDIELNENMKDFVYSYEFDCKDEYTPVYEPTEHANEEEGYLKQLLWEVQINGFEYDLCSICFKRHQDGKWEIGDSCDHDDYDIKNLIDEKLNCLRFRQMKSFLTVTRAQMMALILYIQGKCTYDLCKRQRENDYSTWKWFDYCLYKGIVNLSEFEMGRYPVYSGISGIQMKKKHVNEVYFKTYVSTSYSKSIAKGFAKNHGMLIEFTPSLRRMECCDVSWISPFGENEILFARQCGLHYLQMNVVHQDYDMQYVTADWAHYEAPKEINWDSKEDKIRALKAAL